MQKCLDDAQRALSVLAAIAPRPTLVASGSDDKYSRHADQVVTKVAGDFITELRVDR